MTGVRSRAIRQSPVIYFESAIGLIQQNVKRLLRRMSGAALVLLVTTVGWGAAARGEETAALDYHAGYQDFQAGDYSSAAAVWDPLAEKGDPHSQYGAAILYLRGDGVSKNLTKAIDYLTSSAKSGITQAQTTLGNLFRFGIGTEKDLGSALKWYGLAAEANYAPAQFALGNLYRSGIGVPKNLETAMQWYVLAAEDGLKEAQHALGQAFYRGYSKARDYRTALQWFEKAANQGHASAQFNIGLIYERGQGQPVNFKIARDWYSKAAKMGEARAQYNLAVLLVKGEGGQRDTEAAIKLFRLAAEQGLPKAQYNLAAMLVDHGGQEADLAEAVFWVSLAINRGVSQGIKLRNKLQSRLSKSAFAISEGRVSSWKPQVASPSQLVDLPKKSIARSSLQTGIENDIAALDNEVLVFVDTAVLQNASKLTDVRKRIKSKLLNVIQLKNLLVRSNSSNKARLSARLYSIESELTHLDSHVRALLEQQSDSIADGESEVVYPEEPTDKRRVKKLTRNGIRNCAACPLVELGGADIGTPLLDSDGNRILVVMVVGDKELLTKPAQSSKSSGAAIRFRQIGTVYGVSQDRKFILLQTRDSKWGWVDRNALISKFVSATKNSISQVDICDSTYTPLNSQIESTARKSVMRAIPVKSKYDLSMGIPVYKGPDGAMYEQASAIKSHAILYFYGMCVAENTEPYLLVGTEEFMDPEYASSSLLGWIKRSNGITWGNATAIGYKPDRVYSSSKIYGFKTQKQLLNYLRTNNPIGGTIIPDREETVSKRRLKLRFPVIAARRKSYKVAWIHDDLNQAGARIPTSSGKAVETPQAFMQEGWIPAKNVRDQKSGLEFRLLMSRSKLDVVVGFYAYMWRNFKGGALPAKFANLFQNKTLDTFGVSIRIDQKISEYLAGQLDSVEQFSALPLHNTVHDVIRLFSENSKFKNKLARAICATYRRLQLVQESRNGHVIFSDNGCRAKGGKNIDWWWKSDAGSEYAYIPVRYF